MRFVLRSQKGTVLLLTFIFMVSLAVFVTVYLSLVGYNTKNAGGQTNNVSAFYLAEAGLNKAIYYLLNTAPDGSTDGSWRTTAYPAAPGAGGADPRQEVLGDGTYTMWVESSGSDILITAQGSINGIERVLRQTVTYSAGSIIPEAFTYANFAGGNIDYSSSGGNADISGDIASVGNIDNSNNVPVSGNEEENSDVELPVVDYAAYENEAGVTVVNGDKTFAQNSTSSGMWYVKGNVTIEQGATVNGTIIAEGNISFAGDIGYTGNNGTVTATPPYPALVAKGNIEGGSNNNITVTGAIFSEGNFNFNNCNNFTFTGSIVVYGNIALSSSNNFHITFAASAPPYISGGGVGGDPSINSVTNSWGEI